MSHYNYSQILSQKTGCHLMDNITLRIDDVKMSQP